MTDNSSEDSSNLDDRRKGKKGVRGKPLYHNEVKKRYNFTLTPTAREIMNRHAISQGLSASDWLEKLLRMVGGEPNGTE
ncbi:MAG: hypothetical protein QNJ72_18335 [Pleurocapsa sp. MO_226.B13]|nr:hypothetical protein [Pleurocapsa sp. MO_226.B13]